MTTASDIITQAYREANIIPIGKVPNVDQIAEALPRLNNFIAWLFGSKLGEFVMDWPTPPSRTAPVPANYPLRPQRDQLPSDVWPYPPNNVRILNRLAADTTVYLPYRPNPGSRCLVVDLGATGTLTLDANGRLIAGANTVALAPGHDRVSYIYREDLASWTTAGTLVEADESPLAPEFDDLLICGLARRIAPRFGADVLPITESTYMDTMDKLKQRYQQYMPKTGGFDPVLMSKQAHDDDFLFGDEEQLYGL
jgi:hypothetical protein